MLSLITFKKSGERWEVPVASGAFTIGREDKVNLRIPNNEVSRRHCILNVNGTKATIRDLNSSNGTYVNHQRVKETALKPGDQLTIGPVTFVVRIDGQPREITPAMLASAPPSTPSTAPDGPTKIASRAPIAPPAPAADAEDAFDLDDLSDIDLNIDLSDLKLPQGGPGKSMDDAAFDFLTDEGSDEDLDSPAKK